MIWIWILTKRYLINLAFNLFREIILLKYGL